eukprot:10875053-Alexandrium_andersonii.AAC.1
MLARRSHAALALTGAPVGVSDALRGRRACCRAVDRRGASQRLAALKRGARRQSETCHGRPSMGPEFRRA